MLTKYKNGNANGRKRFLRELQNKDDSGEISYQSFFDDLFSDDPHLVSDAIINLSNYADRDITAFSDCLAFTQILDIASNPIFEDYMNVLVFFDSIISNSVSDEKLLAHFISQNFLSLLKNYLYFQDQNQDIFRILFNIYSNIIYCSECFSKQILSPQFLSRIYEIVKDLPQTSDYFLDLLGCILLRFRILMNFPIDPFPKIISIIEFFFKSQDFILLSNVFSTLVQASSITYPAFVKSFFVSFIVQKIIDAIELQPQYIDADMIQIDVFNVHRKSFFTLKRDALSIILNFSAIDDETRSQLINIGLIDLDCINLCFLNQNDPDKIMSYDSFNEALRMNDQDFVPIQNDLDSSLLPKIAANFFTSNHFHAMQFAYSLFWKSLIKSYDILNFDTKQGIARATTLALTNNDEDLITTILSDEMLQFVIESLTECFANNDSKLEINCIIAIENLIKMLKKYSNITEINLAFEQMITEGLIDEIENLLYIEEDEIPNSLIPRIHDILSFFNDYYESHFTFENPNNDEYSENMEIYDNSY